MAAELLPTLFAVDGVLTTVGVIANAVQPLIAAAQIGTLTYQLQQLTELGDFSKNRAVQAQSQNNVNNLRSNKLEDPNRGTGNAGNDYPEKPWWHPDTWCIGPCDAHAGGTDDEGGGQTRLPGNIRYGVIQRVPLKRPATGRMSLIWHDRKLFKNWLHVEQTNKRISSPLTHDEAKMLVNQAREVGIPKKAFDFNPDGLAGKELRRPYPHFKIEDAHIPVEKGFIPPW